MTVDVDYVSLLNRTQKYGRLLETRNHQTRRLTAQTFDVSSTPLVTIRKTAWKKALVEMEWFMSGKDECPEELADWWKGQLYDNKYYFAGYGHQMRASTADRFEGSFDQVEFVLKGLQTSPNSRRLVMTTWNPFEMSEITRFNKNPNTPTCCHGSMVQFFVEDGALTIVHYQRSADLLLGLPHNLMQYWALGMYFAHHAGLSKMGLLQYIIGDGHVYQDESHTDVVQLATTFNNGELYRQTPNLVYNYSGETDDYGTPKFKAADFTLDGPVPEPLIKIRPKLF